MKLLIMTQEISIIDLISRQVTNNVLNILNNNHSNNQEKLFK